MFTATADQILPPTAAGGRLWSSWLRNVPTLFDRELVSRRLRRSAPRRRRHAIGARCDDGSRRGRNTRRSFGFLRASWTMRSRTSRRQRSRGPSPPVAGVSQQTGGLKKPCQQARLSAGEVR